MIRFFTSQSTIFQLCWDGSSWVEPVLSKDYIRLYESQSDFLKMKKISKIFSAACWHFDYLV